MKIQKHYHQEHYNPRPSHFKDYFNIMPFLGPVFFALILFLPLPMDITRQQQSFLAIMVLVFWSWVFSKVPLFAIGLLGVSLSVLLGVTSANEAFQPFSKNVIFLFLGGFLLSRAMAKSNLDKRIAYHILSSKLISGSFKRMLFLLLFLTALFSMWMSNTASTAMMIPVILGVISSLNINDKRLLSVILISIAYAASLGGLGSPIGSPPNLIAIGLLRETVNINISFLDWMIIAVPMVIIFFGFLFLYINLHLPKEFKQFDRNVILNLLQELPKISKQEIVLTIVFLLTVSLWFFPSIAKLTLKSDPELVSWISKTFSSGVVATVCASLLFIFPINLSLKKSNEEEEEISEGIGGYSVLALEDIRKIDWGSLLLFGSGLSLGTIMYSSGLSMKFAELIEVYLIGDNFFITLLAIIYVTIFATEVISNTATANILLPIIIAMSIQLDLNPVIMTLGVAFASSLSFMLPVATPPNAIVYGTGMVSKQKMMSFGLLLNLVFGFILSLGLYLGKDYMLILIDQ